MPQVFFTNKFYNVIEQIANNLGRIADHLERKETFLTLSTTDTTATSDTIIVTEHDTDLKT